MREGRGEGLDESWEFVVEGVGVMDEGDDGRGEGESLWDLDWKRRGG